MKNTFEKLMVIHAIGLMMFMLYFIGRAISGSIFIGIVISVTGIILFFLFQLNREK